MPDKPRDYNSSLPGGRHGLRAVLLAAVVLLSSATMVGVAHHEGYEPDDSPDTATTLTTDSGGIWETELGVGDSLTGNVNGTDDYDEDWFAITAQGDSFQITLESNPTEEGDIGVTVYDSSLTVVGANNTGKPVPDSGEPASLAEVNATAGDADGDGDLEAVVQVDDATDGATYYVKVYAHDDPTNEADTYAAQECGLESDGDGLCDGSYEIKLSFPPTADAGDDRTGAAAVDAGSEVTFDAGGTTDPDDAAEGLTFSWEFGDGTTETGTGLVAPSHTYSEPGTYTATLTVMDSDNGIDRETVTVEVTGDGSSASAPDAHPLVNDTAGMSMPTFKEDTPLEFDATRSSGDIESYTWVFDDGTTARGDYVTHAFEEPGTYEVTLYTNGSAGTDSETLEVTVDSRTHPTAATGGDRTVGAGTMVTFDAGNSTDVGPRADYEWSFGDGTGASGEVVGHAFDEQGVYTVTLTVTDRYGNADTATATVTVTAAEDVTPPTARAGEDRTVTVGTPVTLDAGESTDNGLVSEYAWVVDDNRTLSGATATHAFAHPGNHTVELRVTDASGNVGTDTVNVTVEDETPPTARAGPDRTVGVEGTATLNASNTTDNGAIDSYRWEISPAGDSTPQDRNNATPTATLRGASVEYGFERTGDYTATLTVVDAAGNADTATVNLTVEDETPPTADYDINRSTEAGEPIEFDASNATDNVGLDRHVWGFGDRTLATGETVTHRYDQPGTYVVALTVVDEAGNRDVEFVWLTIE